ncbi:MAG: nitroreductase family protein [Elusimicrobia bacterium]|nr:nitroreductase family protein [Elusimicrobiota bacterium]
MAMLKSPFLELVAKRRSIRKYKPLPVEREKLSLCLEAARLAPSACNAQPYRFIVVDEPELKGKVSKAAFSGIYSVCKFAAGAGALVFVVSERGKFSAWFGNRVQSTDFRLVDVGIAAEHFVLAAAEQGIGTCWLGWFNAKAAARALGLGPGKKVEIILSAGYPDEAPSQRQRKSMEDFSVFNGGC